jgi:hypothetical protein
MDDSIAALLTGQPGEDERRAALTAALRQQKFAGMIGQMMGGRHAASSQAMIQDSDQTAGAMEAQRGQGLKLAMQAIQEKRAQEQAMKQAMHQDRMAALQEQQIKNQAADSLRDHQRGLAQIDATRENTQTFKQAAAAQKADELAEKKAQLLGKDLADVEAPSMLQGLKTIKAALKTEKGKDIPGVGMWDSKKPAFMQSEGDTKNEQAIIDVMQKAIKAQSGQAVSRDEAIRMAKSLGFFGTEQQFRVGVPALEQKVLEAIRSREAKYPGEIRDLYRSRGGITSLDYDDAQNGATKPQPKRIQHPNGKTYEIDENGDPYEVE